MQKIRATDEWFRDYDRYLDAKIEPLITDAEKAGKREVKRVKVAVLDTGIDLTNSSIQAFDLTNRIKERKNLLAGDPDDIQDRCGHGSHVSESLLRVAPCADIYVARITESERIEKEEYVVKAIDWAVECKVDIIVMPLAFDRCDSVHEAIERARRENIIMFAAASNDGARTSASWPATHELVIGVHSANGDGVSSSFTPSPDQRLEDNFATVGEAIEASWINVGNGGPSHSTVMRKSGTSFATPILAGFVATILYYIRSKFPQDGVAARAGTRAGILSILRLKDMCDKQKSLGYAVLTPAKFWENGESAVYHLFLRALKEGI